MVVSGAVVRIKLLLFPVLVVASMTSFWLVGFFIVKRRFAELKSNLSESYQSSITAPSSGLAAPSLAALCIDLTRREHCHVPFDALSAKERRLVLHTLAIENLPNWMSRFGSLFLWPAERALIARLRDVHTSRPEKPKLYFGAIKRQQQLRSRPET